MILSGECEEHISDFRTSSYYFRPQLRSPHSALSIYISTHRQQILVHLRDPTSDKHELLTFTSSLILVL